MVKAPDERVNGRDESDSDAEAFAREMADVLPLRPDPRGRVRPERRTAATSPVEGLPRHRSAGSARPGAAAPLSGMDAESDSFAADGVDRRELRKLKRGEHVAEDACDLHGLTAAEACARVASFIERSRHRGHRCVRIVHGRGLHSEGQMAVLRNSVRDYLRRHPAVLAFADAPRTDGGAGAVYVLLRR
jgi:DNA-nicking Smr family endonuclease